LRELAFVAILVGVRRYDRDASSARPLTNGVAVRFAHERFTGWLKRRAAAS
jgi:hypothetical protein